MSETTKKSVFETLNAIDVSEHIEKKNGLSYLSWAWAWATLKKYYPDAFYTVYRAPANDSGEQLLYHTDGKTAWVETGVTVEGVEYIEYLPIMDNRNMSILVDNIKSTDVNKSIQRSITKAISRHGLGLYIYAGEDLPEEVATAKNELAAVIEQIGKVAQNLVKNKKITKEELVAIITKHHSSANYNTITDIDIANKLLAELNKL